MRNRVASSVLTAATLAAAILCGCSVSAPSASSPSETATATPTAEPTPTETSPLEAPTFESPRNETQAVADASAAAAAWHEAQQFAYANPTDPDIPQLRNFAEGEVLSYALTTVDQINAGVTSVSGTSKFRVEHGGTQGALNSVHLHACVDNTGFDMLFHNGPQTAANTWPNGGVFQTRLDLEFHDGRWVVISDWVRGTPCDD